MYVILMRYINMRNWRLYYENTRQYSCESSGLQGNMWWQVLMLYYNTYLLKECYPTCSILMCPQVDTTTQSVFTIIREGLLDYLKTNHLSTQILQWLPCLRFWKIHVSFFFIYEKYGLLLFSLVCQLFILKIPPIYWTMLL